MKNSIFRKLKITALALSAALVLWNIPAQGFAQETDAPEQVEIIEEQMQSAYAFDPLDCTSLIGEESDNLENEVPRVGAVPGSEYTWWKGDAKDRAGMLAEYEAVVASILAQIDPSWTDVQKVVFLHDYIATHAEYAFDENGQVDQSDMIVQSAYGNLVLHRSVCDGYARAFYDLANRAGIETYDVVSDQISHAWNMVVIDGKHYYLDVTWDGQNYGDAEVYHTHCLKSGSYFYYNDHTATDWEIKAYYNVGVSGTQNVYGKYDDKEYDNAPWTSSDAIIVMRNGYAVYYGRPSETNHSGTITAGIYKTGANLLGSETLQEFADTSYNETSFFDCSGKILFDTYQGFYVYDESTNGITQVISMINPLYYKGYSNISLTGTKVKYDIFQYNFNTDSWDTTPVEENDLSGYISNNKVRSISLNKKFYSFSSVGQTLQLSATVVPAQAGITKWESSDTSVVTVDSSGLVKAVGAGSAYVKAYSGNQQMWCYVEVCKIDPKEKTVTVTANNSNYQAVSVNVYPVSSIQLGVLNWKSSNESVVTVSYSQTSTNSNGVATNYLKGVGKGSATITVSSSDGAVCASFSVKVINGVSSVSVSGDTKLDIGASGKLTATILPKDADGDLTVTWSSSDSSVVSVDKKGNIKGLKEGTARITATVQGISGSVQVKVENKGVTFVYFSAYYLSVKEGKTKQFECEYLPKDAIGDLTPKWSSSDTSIATVDDKGVVKGIAPGEVTISVEIQGHKDSVDITVQEDPNADKYNEDDHGEDNSGSPMEISGLDCGWNYSNGKAYWYENGIKQGTYYDEHGVMGDGSIRGREIYDSVSDGWYWLDSVYFGAKAVGKEVWIPYIYQDEDNWSDESIRSIANESDPGMEDLVYNYIKEKKGKWVRYDENGRMLKGWVRIEGALAEKYPDQVGNTYYYDNRTGLMAKGWVTIGGTNYYFDENSGVLQ